MVSSRWYWGSLKGQLGGAGKERNIMAQHLQHHPRKLFTYVFGFRSGPSLHLKSGQTMFYTSTPQLPFKRPQIPSNKDLKALNRGTLGGLGMCSCTNRLFVGAGLDPLASKAAFPDETRRRLTRRSFGRTSASPRSRRPRRTRRRRPADVFFFFWRGVGREGERGWSL